MSGRVRLLVVDSYDSFTWNVVQAFEVLGASCEVVANDAVSAAWVRAHPAAGVVLSPGPCAPKDAGVVLDVVRGELGRRPLLGVCLGHQAIAEALGARVVRAKVPLHGMTSPIRHAGAGLFEGLPNPFEAMRYHSLVVDPASLPAELEATAWSPEDEIMALAHRSAPAWGLQFHPESHASPGGEALFAAFLRALRD